MAQDPFELDEAEAGARLDPLVLLRKAWQRRWLFFVPFLICLAMAMVAVKIMTPIYESTGQIRIIRNASTSRLIEDGTTRAQRSRDLESETLANIWMIVMAPKFVEKVVAEYYGTGADSLAAPDAPDYAEAVGVGRLSPRAERLSSRIRVRSDGLNLFRIGVRHTDPDTAAALARVVLQNYLVEERQARMAPRSTTRDFLDRQRETYLRDLQEAEAALAAHQRTAVSATLTGNPVNAANLATVEASVGRIQQQLAGAELQELRVLEAQARVLAPGAADVAGLLADPAIGGAVRRLGDLEYQGALGTGLASESEIAAERMRLSGLLDARFQATAPQVGALDRNRLVQYGYRALYRQALEGVASRLSGYARDYREFTARQPEQATRLAELQNEVARRRSLLDSIEQEITQQSINLEASMSEIGYRIEVRRDPVVPSSPAEPDKAKLSLMGFGLSFAIGLGLVILSIMLDRSFTDVAHMERVLKVPVIGTLPIVHDQHFRRQRQLRILRWTLLVLVILAIAVVFTFVVYPRLS